MLHGLFLRLSVLGLALLPAAGLRAQPLRPPPQVNVAAMRTNKAGANLQKQVSTYAFVTAEGTADLGDHIHFNAASARLLGRRYAVAMQRLQNVTRHKR